jgi:hypothetical protein
MKRSALLLAVPAAVLAGLAVWWFARNSPQRNALHARELATWGLAQALVKIAPGERVLVFSNPFTQRSGAASEIVESEAAGLRGLKRGFGAKLSVAAVVFPELRPDALNNPRGMFIDRETTTPLSFLVATNAFDQAVSQHSNCGVVVSLIGLPAELERVQCWQKPGPPRFALLWPDLRIIGDAAAIQRSLDSGKLAAFVLPKPGAPGSDAELRRADEAEFARRFVLVTRDNFAQVLQTYPGLFPRR